MRQVLPDRLLRRSAFRCSTAPMSIRKPLLAMVVVSALAVLAGGAGSASAASYFHAGTAMGNHLANGDTVSTRAAGTFSLTVTTVGNINCSQLSGSYTVGASGGATVAVSLATWNATTCTDTVPVLTFTGCAATAPLPAGTATGTGAAGGTVAFTNLYVRCAVMGTTNACYYRDAAANGTYANMGATLTFTNDVMVHNAPGGTTDDIGILCGNGGTMSATLADQATAAGTTVLLNNVN